MVMHTFPVQIARNENNALTSINGMLGNCARCWYYENMIHQNMNEKSQSTIEGFNVMGNECWDFATHVLDQQN